MRHLIRIFLFASVFVLPHIAHCQPFKAPDRYSFESIDSYHKYDNDIIKCVNWLEKVSPNDESANVKRSTRFLLEWQTGCPYVHFQPNPRIDVLLNDSPEYKVYYIGGWVRYSLQNDGKADKMMCTYAGLKTLLKVYKQNRFQKHDSNLDDLVKLDENSKLRMWVQEKMN